MNKLKSLLIGLVLFQFINVGIVNAQTKGRQLTTVDLKTYLLSTYSGSDFGAKLQNAINDATAGSVIDCSQTQGISLVISSTITINKPITINLGPNLITASPGTGNNVFNLTSDGINIFGVSRSTKESSLNGKTRITMTNGNYHIFGQGVNQIKMANFDLVGIQSTINTIDGSGGIFLIEPDPYQSGGGNNINQINIDQVLISGSKAHAFFILGCILSEISNCRVSSAGGHGVYIADGSTTLTLRNIYVSSANFGGIVLHSATSCTLVNCAGEGAGAGIWLRSTFNCSLLGCYAEANVTRSNTGIPTALGVQVTTTTLGTPVTTTVDDIGSDNQSNFFKGASLVISGGLGNGVYIFNSTNPGQAGSVGASTVTSHVWVKDGARNMDIYGLRTQKTGSATGTPRFDIKIESTGNGTPRDITFHYNYEMDGTVTPTIANKYITTSNTSGESTVVCNQGTNCDFIAGNRSLSGNFLQIKTGSSNSPNKRGGSTTLVGGTKTISDATVTANTVIVVTRTTSGGTVGSYTVATTAGTGFTITSSSGTDTSTLSYFYVELIP